MSERKTYKIYELVEKVGIGPFGSSIKVDTFVKKGVPVISGTHLKGFRLEDKNYNFITVEHADMLKNANVKRGDVIFTHAGNIGAVAFIPENSKYERYILSQRQFYLRCKREKLLPEYITYYFKSPYGQKQLLANVSSVGVPSIAKPVTYLRSIEVEIPNINEQKNIVLILESLENKIELNAQMNQTLEAMAQTTFKEWFINYKFPGFDGELVDGLPKGWKRGKVGEEFNLTMGQSPPGETYNEIGDGMIFYQGRTDFGFRFPENRMYTTSPNRIAEALDTLVSVRAPVGDINMAIERCCIGRGLSAIRHKSGAYSYTFYSMKSVEPVFRGFEGEGTVFGSINKGNFENIEIISPERKIIEEFEVLINPIDEKILNNSQEIKSLKQIRDSILPKLMSGKMEIKK